MGFFDEDNKVKWVIAIVIIVLVIYGSSYGLFRWNNTTFRDLEGLECPQHGCQIVVVKHRAVYTLYKPMIFFDGLLTDAAHICGDC